MLQMHCSQKDVDRFTLSELHKAENNKYYQPVPINQAKAKANVERREQRKLYGTSKYKPDGTKYTPTERPWIF